PAAGPGPGRPGFRRRGGTAGPLGRRGVRLVRPRCRGHRRVARPVRHLAPDLSIGAGWPRVLTKMKPPSMISVRRPTETWPVSLKGGFTVVAEGDTRMRILAAAKGALLDVGYANLATRGIAEAAGVPLSQIHYHFGSKQNLMLAVLDMENQQRLARQAAMYQSNLPLWKQWQQACDFFDEDLESGYVRVLMEMTAAGWSNREIAAAVSTEV